MQKQAEVVQTLDLGICLKPLQLELANDTEKVLVQQMEPMVLAGGSLYCLPQCLFATTFQIANVRANGGVLAQTAYST